MKFKDNDVVIDRSTGDVYRVEYACDIPAIGIEPIYVLSSFGRKFFRADPNTVETKLDLYHLN